MANPAIPGDTTADAHEVQRALYARMGGPARAAIAFRLTETIRQVALAGIRRRHPQYSDDEVFRAWARLTLGDDLTRAVWPDRELVDP
jgi:hypothetical protein